MRLTKKQREAVRGMFGGRCAYCGEPLGERWHADHVERVERDLKRVTTASGATRLVTTGQVLRPERDVIENLRPSCPPCNLYKGGMSVEEMRRAIERLVTDVLPRDSSPFRHAARFGQLEVKAGPVVFHFERLAAAGTGGARE